MRFKTGFVLGCAAGAWAASKAAQVRRGGRPGDESADWPQAGASWAQFETTESSSGRQRPLGDLARERLTVFLDSPLGDRARARVVEMLTTAPGRRNGVRGQQL
jgi:hypothetical protein